MVADGIILFIGIGIGDVDEFEIIAVEITGTVPKKAKGVQDKCGFSEVEYGIVKYRESIFILTEINQTVYRGLLQTTISYYFNGVFADLMSNAVFDSQEYLITF
jgi:hypothetical protein